MLVQLGAAQNALLLEPGTVALERMILKRQTQHLVLKRHRFKSGYGWKLECLFVKAQIQFAFAIAEFTQFPEQLPPGSAPAVHRTCQNQMLHQPLRELGRLAEIAQALKGTTVFGGN